MKKILLFAVAAAVTFTACKKKAPTEEDEVIEIPLENPDVNVPFSNLSTEQHKQNLEQSGIQFVQKINSLPDEQFVDVLNFFADLEPEIPSTSISSLISVANAANSKNIQGIFRATTSATASETKLSEIYGIYTWNKNTKKWDETASTSKLEFKFPSSSISSSNDATLTFSYVPSSIKATIDGEKVELPASATSSLKVGSTEILKCSSSYEYKADGTPTLVNVNLVLGSFNLQTKVENTTKNLNAEMSFKKGSEVLLSLSTAAVGNMTVTHANTIDDNFGDFIKNANATFQIMNVKIVGIADIKAIEDKNKASSNLSDSLRNVKEAEAMNLHAQFVAMNKSDNSVIAKVSFVPVSDRDCYSYYNGTKMVQTCYSDYYLEPRLTFKDGSKQSFEFFTDNGFSQLIDDLEDFADKF